MFLEFNVYNLDYTLQSNGRTIKQDMVMRPVEGVNLTQQIVQQWLSLQNRVVNTSGFGYFNTTLAQLQAFVVAGQQQAVRVAKAVGKL